jgi:uncharacterized protein YndB with AHSA1/START domain
MIRRLAEMPVTAERLWEALTDPDQVAGWFGASVEWDLRPGGRARFSDPQGGDREGQVEEVRPGRYLRFTWWPVSDPDDTSEVSYLLEPAGEGSRLTIQERRVDSEAVVIQDTVSWSTWDARLLGAWGDISMRADARA